MGVGVILHEMAHVLGIGTLWEHNSLHNGDCTSDYYSGAIARQKWADLGCTGDLPVETDGNCPGTAGAHWDELCMVCQPVTTYGSFWILSPDFSMTAIHNDDTYSLSCMLE
jgi:hypothetical protein